MTHHDFDPSELLDGLRERPDLDLVRQMVAFLYQALIEAEATEVIGAEPHERSGTRTTRRNGHRPRTLSTKAGDVDLKIPKSPSCARARSFRACSSAGDASTRPSTPW